MKRISEKRFKSELQQREKKGLKEYSIYEIFVMFRVTGTDLFQRCSKLSSIKECNSWKQEVIQLRYYINQSFDALIHRFNCVVPYITPKWACTSSYFRHFYEMKPKKKIKI